MSVHEDDLNLPLPSSQLPPSGSQSHFAKFDNFTPDDDASFDHEFARLASSQQWVLGSQQYTRERTITMREELKLLYFSQSQSLADINEEPMELNEEQKLRGYRDLCNEVGISPSNSIDECKKHLKSTLVNIVDLIDARRTGSVAKVWHDFDAFRKYTLQDEHRINKEEAKKGEGFLASLLQDFGRRGRRKRNGVKRNTAGSRVVTGQVGKRSHRKRRQPPIALR
ncbi:hypothetical protein S40288_11567 [Stachybotrys chartarum IBT 40288]|nr:hypothetical protein S40288_11567 [Stachybotrys chartarum IBT 40288]